jgi:hypothetical protein
MDVFLHVNAIKIKRFITNIFLCKTMSIQQKNSPKMKFWVSEIEIWYAWLRLHKNWLKIICDKKIQLHFILCTGFWTRQQAVVRLPDPTVHPALKPEVAVPMNKMTYFRAPPRIQWVIWSASCPLRGLWSVRPRPVNLSDLCYRKMHWRMPSYVQ